MSEAVLTAAVVDIVSDGFATIPEAAKYLNLSRAKVYLMMDVGELKYAKFGRSRRIPWRALKEYAQQNLVAC
jgi:excisionase family DNA binding protein